MPITDSYLKSSLMAGWYCVECENKLKEAGKITIDPEWSYLGTWGYCYECKYRDFLWGRWLVVASK